MPAVTTMFVAGMALTAAGVGTQVMGAMKAADANKEIARQEQQAEAQRKLAMELDAKRKTLEQVRVMQRAHSLALNNANNQGASLGSGLQGGYGQIAGQGGTNLLGIAQNKEIGENLFDINALISQQKMNLADAQGLTAMGQGMTTLGNAAVTNIGTYGKLTGGFPTGNVFGGGAGYPTGGYNAYRGWA